MSSLTYLQLLRGNQPFRRLLAGQVVSELGNWFNFIAALGLVRATSGSAPGATAAILLTMLVPFGVLAPFAGALVDRWPRRSVMIAADVARAAVALGYLFVGGADSLWVAYACAASASVFNACFETAKNGAIPNITGSDGLLAGNALMFSTRFLFMSLGAMLGGWAAARFGYRVAFIINSASFLVSAYSIWLIPAEKMREEPAESESGSAVAAGSGFWMDFREGWKYIARYPLVAAIMGLNILWATGGGACNLIYDRLGAVVFAGESGFGADSGLAFLYASVGAGVFVGIILARRVGAAVELHGVTAKFIGVMFVVHGVLFAIGGLMPSIWLAALMFFLSRFVIGMEFTVQETLMMRLLPDRLRGRIITTDRAAEIFVMSISMIVAAGSLKLITPRMLAVISGLLSATPGLIWLALFAAGKLRIPESIEPQRDVQDDQSVLATAG